MTRSVLLESIATTVSDYRMGEISAPTSEHVDRWVMQFASDVQVPILKELNHVLKHTYINRNAVERFLFELATSDEFSGASHCDFWRKANFLRIQANGHSQEDMLRLFDEVIYRQCGLVTRECGSDDGDYIYLDDVIFSGSRVGNDLEEWIRGQAPSDTTVRVVVLATHNSGQWLLEKRLKKAVEDSCKNIKIKYWRMSVIENRKAYRRDSEVLWPTAIPDDDIAKNYVAADHKFPFEPRPAGGQLGPFSSAEGRLLLEREFLLAGLRIRGGCAHPKQIMRPLGFSPFGLGFGSLIVTHRNAPNNGPLALWWGDPNAYLGSPLRKWYPLFARKTYSSAFQTEYDPCGAAMVGREELREFGLEDE